ncbi:MAG: response regulator transcription factor [Proteobacteria bacterium]|nr:response regulator transcription factor [Pseudomonadota bacterium]
MMTDAIVYVVDDDDAVRDSLKVLLESDGLNTQVYASGREFMDSYNDYMPGCLLLDVQLPDMNGLEIQLELVNNQIKLPIIIITGYADVPIAVKALKAGAVDFIEKPFSDDRILASVRHALQIGDRNLREQASLTETKAKLERLTDRERQVLEQLVVGRLNKVIAFELGISARTVEIHRARIMEKMEARSLAHLVRLTLALGIKPEIP